MEIVLLIHYLTSQILNKWTTIGLAVVFAMILLQRECSHAAEKKDIKQSYDAVIAFKDGERNQIKQSLDLKVQDSVVMAQNIMSNKVAMEQLEGELNGYKNINAYLKSEVITSVKNLEAKYNEVNKNQFDGIQVKDGKYIHMDDVDKNFIRIPRTFSYKDDWMALNGTVKKESTIIDSLGMFNKFDAVIGYKRPEGTFGFLKKKSPVVELKSYNPYTKINYVNNITIKGDDSKAKNILLSKPAFFIYGVIGGKVFLN